MGGGNAALEESYFTYPGLRLITTWWGGGCCVSFNDLRAESALADFGTESVFLTWKQSQELFFFSLSWPKVDQSHGGGVMLQFVKWPWSRVSLSWLLNRVRLSDLDDLGAKSAFSDYRAELVLADLKTKSDVTQKQYLFLCVVRGGIL